MSDELPFAEIVTEAQLRVWEAEYERLGRTAAEAQKKAHALGLMIKNAQTFLVGSKPAPSPEPADDDLALTDVIVDVVQKAGRPMDNEEIRRLAGQYGNWARKLTENPKYYYTVMHRLVRRGQVQKIERGRYLVRSDQTKTPEAGNAPGAF